MQELQDVFISYKREERAEARKLAQALACYGVTAWYDTSLEAGEVFERRLRNEMDRAAAIIVLWCPLSISPESYVRRIEAPYAASVGKLLPAMIKPCDIPKDFEKVHTVNLVNWNRRANNPGAEFLGLLKKLAAIVGRELIFNAERAALVDDLLQKQCNPGGRERFFDAHNYKVPSMVAVPDGHFTAGTANAQQDETPGRAGVGAETPHRVFFENPFAVSCSPISVAEFREFDATSRLYELSRGAFVCVNDRLEINREASWRNPGFVQAEDHPVTCVSWYEAKAYTAWLTEVTGQPYRLLSESEWEYVARARTQTAFWFGEAIDAGKANFDSRVAYKGGPKTWDYRRGTTPVRKFPSPPNVAPENPWGLSDVHGNVAEWCEDSWHDQRDGAPPDGRAITDIRRVGALDDRRAIRGGSWRNPPADLRSAARSASQALDRHNHIGFRVARNLPALSSV